MRRVFVVIIAFALVSVSSCGTPSTDNLQATATPPLGSPQAEPQSPERPSGVDRAILLVFTLPEISGSSVFNCFPHYPGVVETTIRGGGPAPGEVFLARCETSVSAEGSDFYVSLRLSWAQSSSAATTDEAQWHSHVWQFKVTIDWHVISLGDSGDIPPQMMK